MDRPREFSMPKSDKPPPPPPPPMREMRGPFGAETKESKERTAAWQRGEAPHTTEWRHRGRAMPPGWQPGDPVPSKRTTAQWFKLFHMCATVFWVLMIYPTVVYWKSSIEYLVFISIYAIIISHLEAWQTSRVERQAEKKEEG